MLFFHKSRKRGPNAERAAKGGQKNRSSGGKRDIGNIFYAKFALSFIITRYSAHCSMKERDKGLGLFGLSAIVFGSMVGGGIFALPQNMAASAWPGAVALAWLVTGIGILLLVLAFKALADTRPDLNAGIYQYAQEGYGRFAGYCMAWGYWLCAAFGNVAFCVLVIDAFGGFFPELLSHGWQAALLGSALIWGMCILACRGLRTASFINNAISVIKALSLILITCALVASFNAGVFTEDFWGNASDAPVGEQVKGTMLVTIWCFLGVEGAVIMGARAKRPSDIGKAGIIGFGSAWALYVFVSLLCYGVMAKGSMAALNQPSVAYVLRDAVGEWAFVFVIASVIVSLIGGLVAWTLICAQVPHQAAEAGIFPGRFRRLNSHGMPAFGMVVSSVIMQLFMIMVLAAPQAYLAALDIASMMVLPAYFFCSLFLLKMGLSGSLPFAHRHRAAYFKAVGIGSGLYCLWAMYAGGLELLMETSIFYVSGLGFYFALRKHRHERMLTRREFYACLALCLLAIASAFYI